MAKSQIEVSSKIIGNIEINGIFISKELGFYRLGMQTKITISREEDINPIQGLTTPVIFGNLALKVTLNNNKNIGYAFPESPIWLKSIENTPVVRLFNFYIDINQQTLDAIEEARDGKNDLVFTCSPQGVLFSGGTFRPHLSPNLMCREIEIQIPRSDWCKKLVDCGYCETMIVEINISNRQNSILSDRVEMLKIANEKLLSGYYADAVANCRKVIENIFDEDPEFKEAKEKSDNAKIGNEKEAKQKEKKLSKDARIYRYNEALFLIECLSIHNTENDTGDVNWNREDAKMIIGSTALLLQWLTAKIEG